MRTSLVTLIRKNGFGKHLDLSPLPDTYNSTMHYTIFNATTENLEKFEKYIATNLFNKGKIPKLTPIVKDTIVDNLLELFNNVIDHAESDKVFVCGQYFPRSYQLTMSIVDLGNTIKYNVTTFLNSMKLSVPDNTIQWAIQKGNSTKSTSAPGGLGLNILQEFLFKNSGEFLIISADEYFRLQKGKNNFTNIKEYFNGTIITVSFNLKDPFNFLNNDDLSDIIIF